jgi:hypothetical protein
LNINKKEKKKRKKKKKKEEQKRRGACLTIPKGGKAIFKLIEASGATHKSNGMVNPKQLFGGGSAILNFFSSLFWLAGTLQLLNTPKSGLSKCWGWSSHLKLNLVFDAPQIGVLGAAHRPTPLKYLGVV